MKTDKPIKAKTATQTAAKAPAVQALTTTTAPERISSIAEAKAPAAPAIMATARREISPELIAARAYNIWEQEGCPQGHDVANWLLAETQLKQEQAFTA